MARANPNLLSQLVIYDYSKTLNAVAAQGFRFGRMHERNRRGVMFSKKRVARTSLSIHCSKGSTRRRRGRPSGSTLRMPMGKRPSASRKNPVDRRGARLGNGAGELIEWGPRKYA